MMLNNKHNVKDCYPASFSFFFICTVQKLFLPLQHQTISQTIKNNNYD